MTKYVVIVRKTKGFGSVVRCMDDFQHPSGYILSSRAWSEVPLNKTVVV